MPRPPTRQVLLPPLPRCTFPRQYQAAQQPGRTRNKAGNPHCVDLRITCLHESVHKRVLAMGATIPTELGSALCWQFCATVVPASAAQQRQSCAQLVNGWRCILEVQETFKGERSSQYAEPDCLAHSLGSPTGTQIGHASSPKATLFGEQMTCRLEKHSVTVWYSSAPWCQEGNAAEGVRDLP